MILLSIDPGHSRKTPGLGWTSFELPSGKLLDMGQILPEDLLDLLRTVQPQKIVCESYRNRPKEGKRHAHTWSDNKESQTIGALRMYCEMQGVELTMQEPSCKDMGLMYSDTKLVKNHAQSHEQEAYGHGVFYIVKNKYRTVGSYLKHKEWKY